MRILIAEDDAALAEALRFSLTQAGYAVDRVVNGVEADEARGIAHRGDCAHHDRKRLFVDFLALQRLCDDLRSDA